MLAIRSGTLAKMPRRRLLSVRSRNQRSTWLSQLDEVGVKCRWNRLWRASQLGDVGVLVGGVVVQDQMDLEGLGNLGVDGLEEGQELLVAVSRQALADDLAGEHVQRCEQGGGAVTLVVVGHRRPRGPGPSAVRPGCGRGPGSEDFSSMHNTTALVGRVQVQADDVDQLLGEPRVVADLERVDPVRLQPELGPDPLHRGRADPDPGGHRPARPVGVHPSASLGGQPPRSQRRAPR